MLQTIGLMSGTSLDGIDAVLCRFDQAGTPQLEASASMPLPPKLRQMLWANVRKLNEQGTTILLTTHYLEEAEELCDEIAVINYGEIVVRDSKDNLMQRFDSKELVLTLDKHLEKKPDGLGGLQACAKDGKLFIKYQPSQVSFQEIINQVQSTGHHIR